MPCVTVSFVNVGFGDCTAILDKNSNRALVIDCPPWGVDAALGALDGCRLDTIVVSHLDLDHFGGVTDLISRAGGCRDIKMAPAVSLDSTAKIKIKAFAREVRSYLRHKTDGFLMRAGDDGTLGDVKWRCLSPGLLHELEALVTRNNRASIVLRIDLGDLRILIGSDADAVVWRDLIDHVPDELRAEVLRYPHHGAPIVAGTGRASLRELLGVVQPSCVILSIGERIKYGHPKADVISDLRASNCDIMCTRSTALCNGGSRSDQPCAGTISLNWTPTDWNIHPSKAKHGAVIATLPTPACRASTGTSG
jgi:competence protein ComEC